MQPKPLLYIQGYKFRTLEEKRKYMIETYGHALDLTGARSAWMLRVGMANARDCRDLRCRRQDMCSRPPLKCLHRPRADQFDWDWGWFHCPRKQIYGVKEDAWMPAVAGLPEERERQKLEHMRMRKMMSLHFGEEYGKE